MAHFKHIYLDLFFTDYKIRSHKFLAGALYLTFLVLVLLIGTALATDSSSSTLNIKILGLLINVVLIFAYIRRTNIKLVQTCFLIFFFFLVEGHVVINPHSFHALIYWFPFIPIAAIIISGLSQALLCLGVILLANVFNFIYVRTLVGDAYEITISVTPLFIIGTIFALTTFVYTFFLYKLLGDAYNKMKIKSSDLETLKTRSETKKLRLMGYQKSLFDLSKDPALTSGNFQSIFKKICTIAAHNLEVNRISVWMFADQSTALERRFLFNGSDASDQNAKITKEAYPKYFNQILSDKLIVADDAFVHPSTSELVEAYLRPLQIFSMLDSPITLDGKTIGIISCENQKSFRSWSAEDILFVQSLADFIALGFKSFEVRSLLQKIRSQNRDLKEKGKVIEGYNEELSALNEELKITNESLEAAVRHRTSVLEQQNKQLSEYAFINSHLLRAPLSRILGLTYIISKEKLDIKDSKLLNALTTASEDLDDIVRKISSLLYKGNDFNRNDINEMIEMKLKARGENSHESNLDKPEV